MNSFLSSKYERKKIFSKTLKNRFEYFIPQLLMSAKAMKGAMALIRPLLVGDGVGDSAICAITGTVKGDVHDIGKKLLGA